MMCYFNMQLHTVSNNSILSNTIKYRSERLERSGAVPTDPIPDEGRSGGKSPPDSSRHHRQECGAFSGPNEQDL